MISFMLKSLPLSQGDWGGEFQQQMGGGAGGGQWATEFQGSGPQMGRPQMQGPAMGQMGMQGPMMGMQGPFLLPVNPLYFLKRYHG